MIFEYAEYCREKGIDPEAESVDPKWLNAKCDVQAMWSHIHASNDVFVTEDQDFLTPRRKSALIALGAGNILTPNDAVAQFLADARPTGSSVENG